jgi:DNA polymerase
MKILFCDTETFCATPINHGTHKYAEAAEVMLWAYGFDDEPVQVWDLTAGDPMPVRLREGLDDPEVLTVWHNSQFDRTVIRHALSIELPVERVHDTMVRALAHSLPGSLGKLCEVMGVPTDQSKDKAGRQLIQLFCKPRPKNQKIRRATSYTHPKDWEKFIEYAALDVEAMRVLYRKLPTWNYSGSELGLWQLDQQINDLGVAVDRELAVGAVRAVQVAQEALGLRTSELTGGEVARASQRDQLLGYLAREHEVSLPDLKGDTVERALEGDIPAGLRELLLIRLQSTTTSTTKYKALDNAVSSDGRLRGTLQFCGASRTGRWAGRVFQPQNLPRPNLPQDVIDTGIEAIKADCADLITGNVMELVSNTIRGCIVAPSGKRLVVSDLSNIEGRAAAWLAGEDWKLDAFRAFDRGDGPDLYILAFARAFGISPAEVTKLQRQIGKVMELALQYEGGVGAFLTFAAVYGLDLEDLARRGIEVLPKEAYENAIGMYDWRKRKGLTDYGLSRDVFVVCEALKALWREAHPAISGHWRELSDAASEAVLHPDQWVPARHLQFMRTGGWLRMLLPSGRSLCYPSPRVEDGKLTYMGVHQYTRKWQRLGTYGGKLFENACQAVARDVMADRMPSVQAAGFDIVLSVHDELLCEAVDNDNMTSDKLSKLMATPPAWARDIPLAAAGFHGYRYKKE